MTAAPAATESPESQKQRPSDLTRCSGSANNWHPPWWRTLVLHECSSWGPHTSAQCRPNLSVQTPGGVTQKGLSCASKGPFGCANLPRRKYPAEPCELDVHVTQEGLGWGLWQ